MGMLEVCLGVQRALARKKRQTWRPPPAAEANSDDELFRKAGRYHSRLQNVETDCWIFRDKLPSKEVIAQKGIGENLFFWRVTFHPIAQQAFRYYY